MEVFFAAEGFAGVFAGRGGVELAAGETHFLKGPLGQQARLPGHGVAQRHVSQQIGQAEDAAGIGQLHWAGY